MRFININVASFDAAKHHGLALTGEARVTLEEIADRLADYQVDAAYRTRATYLHAEA